MPEERTWRTLFARFVCSFFDKDNETEEQKENNFGKSSADSRCMCMSWYSTPRHESHPCVLQIYQ